MSPQRDLKNPSSSRMAHALTAICILDLTLAMPLNALYQPLNASLTSVGLVLGILISSVGPR
ncbi:hypothetical protein U1Q18_000973, partial [Sarracenia purpurea var. burkii]